MEIDKSTAKRLYSDAPEWLKNQLVAEFGEGAFIVKPWESIQSYEDAVNVREVDKEDKIYPTDAPYIVVFKELCHITKTVNGDWVADFNNPNQKKWEQVFNSSGSGFDFSGSHYYYDDRDTFVGSRLCCESQEQSDYIGKTFISKFKLLITNKK